jgi:hypothetical protein
LEILEQIQRGSFQDRSGLNLSKKKKSRKKTTVVDATTAASQM